MHLTICRHRAPLRVAMVKMGLKPIDQERQAVKSRRLKLRKALRGWLKGQGEAIAAQLVKTLDLIEKARRKAGGDPVAIATAAQRARHALDELEFSEWTGLIQVVEPTLASMALSGARAALDQIGVKAEPLLAQLEDTTAAWAAQRAAEMVGMKMEASGDLVPNPDAQWRIDESTREMLRGVTEQALEEGWSAQELQSAVMDSAAFSAARAETIARTELAFADMAGAMQGYRASGVVAGKIWSTAEDDLVSEECQECAEAGQIPLDAEFPGGVDAPPRHPNCLPGDMRVLASGVTAATKRWFQGDLVVIRTASGKRLSCTPNHPVLTPGGWVAARLLNVGSDVISSRLGQWVGVVDGNDQHVPPSIEKVAGAFGASLGVAPVPVPLSPEDFHGDGEGSEVAVVWADRLLRDHADTTAGQHGPQADLVVADVPLKAHLSSGGAGLGIAGHNPPGRSFVRLGNLAQALVGRHLGPLQALGLALVSRIKAGLKQAATNARPGDSEAISQSGLGLASKVCPGNLIASDGLANSSRFHSSDLQVSADGRHGNTGIAADLCDGIALDIFADAIVDVRLIQFSGHVFNLECKSGYYVAEGIVTHNCRCSVLPVLAALADN